MDTGEFAVAIASDAQAELIARQTVRLLCDLDSIERRIVRLETVLLPLRASAPSAGLVRASSPTASIMRRQTA